MLHGWLPMARHGVVDPGRDAAVLEELRQRVALLRADHVEVIDVMRARALDRKPEGKATQTLRISRGQDSTPLVHGVEAPQQHSPGRRLEVVEAQVEPDLAVNVLVDPTVIAKPTASPREIVVVRREKA